MCDMCGMVVVWWCGGGLCVCVVVCVCGFCGGVVVVCVCGGVCPTPMQRH